MGLAYDYAETFRWHPRYEDIKQSCLLGLCEAALRWNPKGAAAFSTYAYYWMKHYTGKELKDSELPVLDVQEQPRGDAQEDLLVGLFQTSYTRSMLLQLVYELPENERHAVLLKYPLDPYSKVYTDVDIAAMLDCSPSWVGDLRRKAFSRLRRKLIKEGFENRGLTNG